MINNKLTFGIIPLTHGKVAIVDTHRVAVLRKFSWRAVKSAHNWYAKATIGPHHPGIEISMHRFIARTPFGQVCHHKNRNSLDNREDNLVNMEKRFHTDYHHDNNLIVKFEPTPTGTSTLDVPVKETKSSI